MTIQEMYDKLLKGEEVEFGIFRYWREEQFLGRDEDGKPKFQMMLNRLYYDEEDDAEPSDSIFPNSAEELGKYIESLQASV